MDCIFSFYPQQKKLPYIQLAVDGREDPVDDLFYRLDDASRIYTPITKEEAQALIPATITNLKEQIMAYVKEQGSVIKSTLNSKFTHHYSELNPTLNELLREGILNKSKVGRSEIYTVNVNASNPHEQCIASIDVDTTRSPDNGSLDGEAGTL
jgi:ATP sulfurylase